MPAGPIHYHLLSQAAAQPIGWVIETNNPKTMAAYLHEARKKGGYEDLEICTPAEPNTVFIVQKSVELD